MMKFLTWKAWIVVVVVGMTVAIVTFLGLLEARQMLIERQQLREIVELIRTGRIIVGPPPQAPPQPPAASPPEKPK